MRNQDVEVLLFRMQAAYPMSAVATEGTRQEWATSAIMDQPPEIVFAAFTAWRDREMWPPKIAELIHESALVARQLAADRDGRAITEQALDHDGLVTYVACPECMDLGFVPFEDDDRVVMPCMACRPDQYEIWQGGHWRPGHSCGACVARRQGRKVSA